MTDVNQYSVAKCELAQLLETLSISCGCVPHYDVLQPNDSSICTPAHFYACYSGAFQSEVKIQDSNGESKELVRNPYLCIIPRSKE